MCTVPKVACTNWKRFFLTLNCRGNDVKTCGYDPSASAHTQSVSLQQMSNLSLEEIIYRLDNYVSFVMVRDPFTRLLSAYRDKFKAKSRFTKMFWKAIISSYKKQDGRRRHSGDLITWTEFVRYISDAKSVFSNRDGHWARMVDLCFPCQKQYDMIGNYESLATDSRFILDKLGLSDLLDVALNTPGSRYIRRDTTKSSDFKTVQEYYCSLPQDSITNLAQRYMDDFSAFGYNTSELKYIIG